MHLRGLEMPSGTLRAPNLPNIPDITFLGHVVKHHQFTVQNKLERAEMNFELLCDMTASHACYV